MKLGKIRPRLRQCFQISEDGPEDFTHFVAFRSNFPAPVIIDGWYEEFRNNPGWWLTLEAGEDQAAEEPQRIKVIKPWGESGWTSGRIGEFR